MSIKTYDPKSVLVIVGGVPISGYSDGDSIETGRDEDAYMKKIGIDGEASRARNRNRGGFVKLTLMQTSTSNDVLSGFAALDEISNAGVIPVLVKDLSGLSTYFSAYAWVKKSPGSKFGKEVGTREWVLDCPAIDMFDGGNL